MKENERERVPYKEAVKMLPVGDSIHTFVNPGVGVLVGADWPRKDILKAFKKYGVELSGESATNMGHGLVFLRPDPVFVATKKAQP